MIGKGHPRKAQWFTIKDGMRFTLCNTTALKISLQRLMNIVVLLSVNSLFTSDCILFLFMLYMMFQILWSLSFKDIYCMNLPNTALAPHFTQEGVSLDQI